MAIIDDGRGGGRRRLMQRLVQALAQRVPVSVRRAGGMLARRVSRVGLPAAGRGTVQDLYYWVADGRTETNLLLNNFYSVFFPTSQTGTHGAVTVFDASGQALGTADIAVGHLQCAKLTLSRLLRQWGQAGTAMPTFGSLLFTLEVPAAVLERLSSISGPCYFWHRFYIEYVSAASQPAFVHCVDKTMIVRHGHPTPMWWYRRPQARDWAPEMPLNIGDYRRLLVILINRTLRAARVTLTVEDERDQAERFNALIPARGVHRFELTQQRLRRLLARELRMRVTGIPTTWARPVLFKEFENGTISTMHC